MLAACDADDGIKDGMVFPRLSCNGTKNDSCLTGLGASSQGVIPGVLNGAPSPVGPPPPTTQDIDAEAAIAASEANAFGNTQPWTNLSTFRDNAGKLVFYHGLRDPWFSALDTIQYYERLGETNGGAAAVSDWSRLFLVPGMGHCRGGEAALD